MHKFKKTGVGETGAFAVAECLLCSAVSFAVLAFPVGISVELGVKPTDSLKTISVSRHFIIFHHFVHFWLRCASLIEFDQKTMNSIDFRFGTPLRFSMAEGHVRRGTHPRRRFFFLWLFGRPSRTRSFAQEFEATKLVFLFFESSKTPLLLSLVFSRFINFL